MTQLTRDLAFQREHARRLLDAMAEEIGGDEDVRAGTIEGETNLFEVVDKAVARMTELDGMIAGCIQTIDMVKERSARFERQGDRIRDALRNVMVELGLQKMERPVATLSLRKASPSLQVIDEQQVPETFWRTKIEKVLDKRLINTALKDGAEVPGCTLKNGEPVLSIRFG